MAEKNHGVAKCHQRNNQLNNKRNNLWDLAELHSFRLSALQTQGNVSLLFSYSQDGRTGK